MLICFCFLVLLIKNIPLFVVVLSLVKQLGIKKIRNSGLSRSEPDQALFIYCYVNKYKIFQCLVVVSRLFVNTVGSHKS